MGDPVCSEVSSMTTSLFTTSPGAGAGGGWGEWGGTEESLQPGGWRYRRTLGITTGGRLWRKIYSFEVNCNNKILYETATTFLYFIRIMSSYWLVEVGGHLFADADMGVHHYHHLGWSQHDELTLDHVDPDHDLLHCVPGTRHHPLSWSVSLSTKIFHLSDKNNWRETCQRLNCDWYEKYRDFPQSNQVPIHSWPQSSSRPELWWRVCWAQHLIWCGGKKQGPGLF